MESIKLRQIKEKNDKAALAIFNWWKKQKSIQITWKAEVEKIFI